MKKGRLLGTVLLLAPVLSLRAEEARLLRFPSVGTDRIAFTYAGDLYTVPLDGGEARRLTSGTGFEMFSRFSPDGRTIAFTGQYDGNTEVYRIPAEGGEPVRLTWSATLDRDNVSDRMGPNNIVIGWTPDGSSIVYRSRWHTFSGLRGALYTVPAEGGEPARIPATEGGFCSYSPDGRYLAMNRMFREFRTWKYYRGGQADDIWIHRNGTTELENITDHPAQDIFPMWIGEAVYFLSDRDSIMNLFRYDLQTRRTEKMTDFDRYDIKFPSCSDRYIVFENGGWIYRFDVEDRSCRRIPVILRDEGLSARTAWTEGRPGRDLNLAPDGSRVLTNVRGEIFSLPAREGAVYNLTRSSGAHDRGAVWSPDGRTIAWFSDAGGEYQVWTMDFDRPESARPLTDFGSGYPDALRWSPDSRCLYFKTEKRELYALDPATGRLRRLMQRDGGIGSYVISPDGRWIAYTTEAENRMGTVRLYDTVTEADYPVSDPWYHARAPLFSRDGKSLYYTSSRDFIPTYSRVEWNASYALRDYVFQVPLTGGPDRRMALHGDEYRLPDADAGQERKERKKRDSRAAKEEKVTVLPEGLPARAVALPLPAGNYRLIDATADELFYTAGGANYRFSWESRRSKPMGKGRILCLNAAGDRALVSRDGRFYVTEFPGLQGQDPVPAETLRVHTDYAREWEQIYAESWRIVRDHFYLENMHGRDWAGIRDKYAELLPYVRHRHDLSYLIGEMIAELNVGHAYITSGEAPEAERIRTGLLGARFSKDPSGAFRIDHIFAGEDWSATTRSPLGDPAAGVRTGEFVLSVNGIPCSEMKTIYESLVGTAGTTVALRINSRPEEAGARTVYVRPIADEAPLAYLEWVRNNIRKVEEAGNGRIGYIHIPDMSVAGLTEFTKLFYAQLDKEALIIDDRMNGGGNVSPMILERLAREAYRMTMARNGRNGTVPEAAHHGPKVCLIDKYSSSDGDLFPYGFRRLGLGPIIGMRSWGGIVGISGSKPFVDGQDLRTPFFTSYSTEGEWIIENEGVIPDIEVDINPFEDFLGHDAQLDKAVEVLLRQLEERRELPGTPRPRTM